MMRLLRLLGVIVDILPRDDAARWLLGREVRFRHEPVIVEIAGNAGTATNGDVSPATLLAETAQPRRTDEVQPATRNRVPASSSCGSMLLGVADGK